jgi:hypothetical protein
VVVVKLVVLVPLTVSLLLLSALLIFSLCCFSDPTKFVCNFCGKSYDFQSDLDTHTNLRHGSGDMVGVPGYSNGGGSSNLSLIDRSIDVDR